MCGAPSDYKGFGKAIENFQLGKCSSFADKNASRAALVATRRILQRPNAKTVKSQQRDYKIYQLAEQFTELNLYVTKHFEKAVTVTTVEEDFD